MNIWMVSTGEYSYYSVNALFADDHKSEAQAFAVLTGGRVEEHSLSLNPTHEEPPPGQTFFRFHMEKDGTSRDWVEDKPLDRVGCRHSARYRLCSALTFSWVMYFAVYAHNREHAVKIANEIRVQVLAGSKPEEGTL